MKNYEINFNISIYADLAREVNHFENQGAKSQKHGEPDTKHLVKEV